MIKLNKPFALGEVGPHTPNGNFDYSLWYIIYSYNKKNFYLIYLGQLQFKIILI